MPGDGRYPIAKVIAAYREAGSVWRAGKLLGIPGQQVWAQLRLLGYPLLRRTWTKEEYAELAELATRHPIGEVARRLGRPYAGVACKISRLGLSARFGNRQSRKPRRQRGVTKKRIPALKRDIMRLGSIRKAAVANGTSTDVLADLFQRHAPEFWVDWAQSKGLALKTCNYCEAPFYPMSAKQQSCTRACASRRRTDQNYFGGRRRETPGLAEGICQLCEREVPKGLSSHHMLGKENDPDNEQLIAVCQGCHKLIGLLATRTFIDSNDGWQNLIQLALFRKHGARLAQERGGYFVTVEIESLSAEEIADLDAEDVSLAEAARDTGAPPPLPAPAAAAPPPASASAASPGDRDARGRASGTAR